MGGRFRGGVASERERDEKTIKKKHEKQNTISSSSPPPPPKKTCTNSLPPPPFPLFSLLLLTLCEKASVSM